jgi:hypothetical protein
MPGSEDHWKLKDHLFFCLLNEPESAQWDKPDRACRMVIIRTAWLARKPAPALSLEMMF